jgi:GNAT superfamily N-acetyltransferase
MIEPVEESDLEQVRHLIEAAIRHSVARSDEEAEFLVSDTASSLEWWLQNQHSGCHLKYSDAGKIVGVVLLKNGWNLCNLFVAPTHYRQGIGRALFEAARDHSSATQGIRAIRVNSSNFASGFYEALSGGYAWLADFSVC